jgi:hypothetical protein
MSKYSPLQEFLQNSDKTTVTLTFQEIERILNASLPASALNHSTWWANNTTQHAKAWLEAGWLVESPTEAIRKHQVPFLKKTNEKQHEKELKSKYRELCNAYHPDHLDEKDKVSGQRVFCEVKEAWDNKDYTELENIYVKYQKAKSGELRQERLRQEEEQFYYQQESYNNCFDDYIVDREILYEADPNQSKIEDILIALFSTIAIGVIFVNIIQGCPARKEPDITPPLSALCSTVGNSAY